MHILGADYMTVVSCRYNRQAFIYCCAEALQHFPPAQRFSVLDFYSLLQLVCPDIPLSLIQDSALTGCSPLVAAHGGDSPGNASSDPSSSSSTAMYLRHELSTSLFFRFIFTEWLIMLETLFFEGKTRTASVTVTPARLLAKFEEWAGGGEGGLAPSTAQPSLATLRSVLADLTAERDKEGADRDRDRERGSGSPGAGAGAGAGAGVSFDTLISALLRHRGVQSETTAFKPRTLARSSIFRKHDTRADTDIVDKDGESSSSSSKMFTASSHSSPRPLDTKESISSLSLPGIN